MPIGEVIATNRKITEAHHAVLDTGKLESALARPMHTAFGDPLYPSLVGRAGALLHGLVNAHAFQDGNKRTAWVSVNVYLGAFGVTIAPLDKEEVAGFVEDIALNQHDAGGAAVWLAGNIQ